MLKKFLLASAILVTTTGVATAASAPYVGASVGVVSNTATNAGNGNAGAFRGVPVDVFAGYAALVNPSVYLAGEIDSTIGTGELSNKNGMKTNYGYGASFIPGVMLSDHTLGFARVGVVRSRFSNVNSWATGGKFGLGMQTSLTQNVDLRGEYDFTAYKSVNVIGAPRSDAFNLGVVYKFD